MKSLAWGEAGGGSDEDFPHAHAPPRPSVAALCQSSMCGVGSQIKIVVLVPIYPPLVEIGGGVATVVPKIRQRAILALGEHDADGEH